MKISALQIPNKYDGKRCFVHSRLSPITENDLIMTTQYLYTEGSDTFDGIMLMHSHDGGNTWSTPAPDEALSAYIDDGKKISFCDAAHIHHKKTDKILTVGIVTAYTPDGLHPFNGFVNYSFYAVYNSLLNRYEKPLRLPVPQEATFGRGCCSGCGQFVEEDNGDILIPLSITKENGKCAVAVARFAFDGNKLEFISRGKLVEYDGDETSRGLYEPSLCRFKGKYYLTIRNDGFGFWAVSDDGQAFSAPQKWCWDTGLVVPTYNTQSHWLILNEHLYLVYTRRCGSNDHVFRNRAPLFVAEVGINGDNPSILRSTEQIAVPERGARLGNFGVISINSRKAAVTVSEWMQPKGCEAYGSDNSFWVSMLEE